MALLAACESSKALLPEVSNAVNRLTGLKLFVNPDSPAQAQANAWRVSRPTDAALIDRIATQPVAKWIGDWNRNVTGDVATFVSRAAQQGGTPVLVAYNIPNRDCGSYSAGGSANASSYRQWIRDFAAGLGGRSSIVVVEPDAVPQSSCLSAAARDERFAVLRDAIQVLKAANAVVYLDAGNAKWMSPSAIAPQLQQAGLDLADGFSLNVSNYLSTANTIAYGESLSRLVAGKHFIIDTGRNGMGGLAGQWCNVPGQSLGVAPTTNTGHQLVDAYLWVKPPGESDGPCNGGPRAGEWWPDYALGLAKQQQLAMAP